MIYSFDTVDYGKIEVDTDRKMAYFSKDNYWSEVRGLGIYLFSSRDRTEFEMIASWLNPRSIAILSVKIQIGICDRTQLD